MRFIVAKTDSTRCFKKKPRTKQCNSLPSDGLNLFPNGFRLRVWSARRFRRFQFPEWKHLTRSNDFFFFFFRKKTITTLDFFDFKDTFSGRRSDFFLRILWTFSSVFRYIQTKLKKKNKKATVPGDFFLFRKKLKRSFKKLSAHFGVFIHKMTSV